MVTPVAFLNSTERWLLQLTPHADGISPMGIVPFSSKFFARSIFSRMTRSRTETPSNFRKRFSRCRDTGLTLPGQATEKDALNNPRVKYAGVDMGALECIQSLGTYFLFR